MDRNFKELLESRWQSGNFLCVGLDPDFERIPEAVRQSGTRETLVAFNRAIIDATKDLVCSFKLNTAFYEAHGDEGWNAMRETIQYILESAPEVSVILDAKRGDIGNTNKQYALSAFDHLHADAVTVNPYMGGEPLEAFFDYKNKGVIVLIHTSNPGSGEIQNLSVEGVPLYKHIAKLACTTWNKNDNVCLMVGATYPEELKEVRSVSDDLPVLIAGIGAQDGDLQKTIQMGMNSKKKGLIVNASRSIIFASSGADFAEAARAKAQELHDSIEKAL